MDLEQRFMAIAKRNSPVRLRTRALHFWTKTIDSGGDGKRARTEAWDDANTANSDG